MKKDWFWWLMVVLAIVEFVFVRDRVGACFLLLLLLVVGDRA